jgi:hypothetical protein
MKKVLVVVFFLAAASPAFAQFAAPDTKGKAYISQVGPSLTKTNRSVSLNTANSNTWSALQIFGAADLAVLGSSTGYDLLETANTSATNYTHIFPAANDTMADLASSQAFTNKSIAGSEVNSGNVPLAQMPTAGQAMFSGDIMANFGGL